MAFEKFCFENGIVIKKDELMKNHTSFKIGGCADYFVECSSVEQLKIIIEKAKQLNMPIFILGKGSNLLVSDKGIEGVVISLNLLDSVTVNDDEIIACAGATLAQVCVTAYQNALTGLEFAYGIPGTVGGGLYMNAGAYGGEMSQVVASAEYIDTYGQIKTVELKDMQLGYRTSVFKTGGKIITSVKFKLKKGDCQQIKENMDNFLSRRKDKQPLEYPSAGSTFKRPDGYFAGALIEKNGLKGLSVGGAKVSEKHAGFVINYDNASCDDVKKLIQNIKETVFKKDNVILEPEIIFVGRE